MRVLVISDIHANLTALEAVLADAGPVEAVWCLGDLVGYGPDPNECVARVRALPELVCLVGNHDKAALGEIDVAEFNPEAQIAVEWTQQALSAETGAYLRSLSGREAAGRYTLAHGSPRRPVWEYITDAEVAGANFAHFDTPFCLVGHTHSPALYVALDSGCEEYYPLYGAGAMSLGPERTILNPGSVGQPRDRNPQAAYALLDPQANLWEYRRVPYDIPAVQERMKSAGLPERLIRRLAVGW
ncbi:MAG: metallophosphoesterase family protein [Chloroflexi bacterium]|nr:metallophosphoesterase family protein [Chloroflexota bacterium]